VEKKLREVFGHSYQVRCVLTSPSKEVKARMETESPLVKAAKESYGAKVVGRKPRTEEE
jgi:methionyl-tRNA formyltransferase